MKSFSKRPFKLYPICEVIFKIDDTYRLIATKKQKDIFLTILSLCLFDIIGELYVLNLTDCNGMMFEKGTEIEVELW